MESFKKICQILLVFILIAAAILDFGPRLGINNAINGIATILLGLSFVVIHGSLALGPRNMIAFIIITVIVSFTSEAIGVATSLIFGSYNYTDHLGPKILGVPPLIQAAYVAMGYSSFMMARVILGSSQKQSRNPLFALTLVGTMIMVAWDVVMDPYLSTVFGDWIWRTGGPYFGVGIHNYVGWFGTVFIFLLLYQIYAFFKPETITPEIKNSRFFWSQPAIYYGILGFANLLVPVIGGVSLPYASPEYYTGSLESLTYSLALITFFVMGFPVIVVFARLCILSS